MKTKLVSLLAGALLLSASTAVYAQTTLTVAVPNPSAITFGALYVAKGEGYFAEEGLEIDIQVVDGSPAAMQAVSAGQAQVGFPGAGVFLNAVARDVDTVFIYNLYPRSLFGLMVEEGDDIAGVTDLEGGVIGVASSDGAEVAFARSILSANGMTEGENYEFLSVGDGGTAAVAFTRGDIDAYAGPLADAAILSARGITLSEVTPPEFMSFFGVGGVVMRDYMDANPEAIEGFGRAVVRGAEFMSDPANKDAIFAHTEAGNPSEVEDLEYAEALLARVVDRMQPLDEDADAGRGYQPLSGWQDWHQSMIDSGELAEPIEDLESVFTNQFVETWNGR